MNEAPLLEVEDLSLSFAAGPPLLDRLSLSLFPGEILGLVGASGSGKSLTALSLLRLLPSGASLTGEVKLNGRSLSSLNDVEMQSIRGAQIGMVFQEPRTALNPLMRVGEQVMETLRLHRAMSVPAARDIAREVLDMVGLSGEPGALDRYPYELSGGQRQRVAIAMAIALKPPLLIADEPTTALDVITQAQVLRLLKELARAQRMGMVLVTHDLAVVAQMSDRVAVMQGGKIVETELTAELLRHPQHDYTRDLLAATNLKRKAVRATRASSPAALTVSHATRVYAGRRRSLWHPAPSFKAVDDVSLMLHAGETVGIVGESGSGKSSLLRAAVLLDPLQRGEVRLMGEDFARARGATLRRLRRSIQVVFQDPYGSFDPRWTVERLIAEPFFLMDSPPLAAERRRQVAAVLEQVGLTQADAGRLPHEFSGGERQRIAIARALITEPAVIVFDEAVSALDVLVRAQILGLLQQLADRRALAYLFVTHDLHVVRSIADRIYVMQRGRIVEEGATEEIFSAPRHPYTQDLLAATPRFP